MPWIFQPVNQVTVDVVVRNMGVGHTFPGGTNDSNEGWLEFTLKNEEGTALVMSGYIDENGHLDKMAHTFKAVIVDKNSNPINKTQCTGHSYICLCQRHRTGHGRHRPLYLLPSQGTGRKQPDHRSPLLWRKFDRKYTEFAYLTNPEGFKQFDEVPGSAHYRDRRR
jgi:hypothetical protein